MTSISSVASSGFNGHTSKTKRGEGPEQSLQRDLADFLTKQGVSAEDQKSILADIKSAVSASAGGASLGSPGTRPDPTKIQAAVSNVLEKHGVSTSEFSKQFPVPSASQALLHARPAAGKDSTESIQQILEVLSKQADKTRLRTKQADTNTNTKTASSVPTTESNGAAAVANQIQAAYSSSNSTIATGTQLSLTA